MQRLEVLFCCLSAILPTCAAHIQHSRLSEPLIAPAVYLIRLGATDTRATTLHQLCIAMGKV